jgi:hypothetical protein
MLKRHIGWVLACTLVVGLTAVAARAADEKKADATGTWSWKATRGQNEVAFTLKLKQEGEKVTGNLKSGNNDTEIKEGKIDKDGNLSFSVTRQGRNNQEQTTKYTGKVEGDTIKGKQERQGGQGQARDWEAKREKE